MTSTGQQIKAAAIAKAKSAVSSATNGSNGSASKKRRANNQLKPIITSEGQQNADRVANMTSNSNAGKYVKKSWFSAVHPLGPQQRQCMRIYHFIFTDNVSLDPAGPRTLGRTDQHQQHHRAMRPRRPQTRRIRKITAQAATTRCRWARNSKTANTPLCAS